jgi:phenylacetate-CoA ligase
MLKLALLDIAKQTNINKWYKFYLSALKWDRNTLINYQNKRLNQLLSHAYENVPYYKSIFNDIKLTPQQIKSIKDLSALPVLGREIIRSRLKDLINIKSKVSDLRKGSSSGTTGMPIEYYFNNDGLSAGIASGYNLWGLSGWYPGQRSVHIWGNSSSIKRWNTLSSKIKTFWMNQLNIPSVLFDDPKNLPLITKQIMKFHPESIDGYSGSIFTLARYLESCNLKLNSVKRVITTAENLEFHQKEVIEKILAPTGDMYGCGELLGIASRPSNYDRYYVFEPHVIVETMYSGIEGMKDVLVTDLDNFVMPLIRYKVGDMIDELNPPSADSRYSFSWFTRIMGRSSDIITLPNGMLFHPVNIFGGTLFRKFPEIDKHKVIWNGELVKFLFETIKPVDKAGLELKLGELLKPYEIPFQVEFTQKILPSPGGKFKYLELIDKATRDQ